MIAFICIFIKFIRIDIYSRGAKALAELSSKFVTIKELAHSVTVLTVILILFSHSCKTLLIESEFQANCNLMKILQKNYILIFGTIASPEWSAFFQVNSLQPYTLLVLFMLPSIIDTVSRMDCLGYHYAPTEYYAILVKEDLDTTIVTNIKTQLQCATTIGQHVLFRDCFTHVDYPVSKLLGTIIDEDSFSK